MRRSVVAVRRWGNCRRRRSRSVVSLEKRAWSYGRLFGMDRRRRWSVVAALVVWSRCAGRLVVMNRRRRWRVVFAMVVRTRSAGRLVAVNWSWRWRWSVVVAAMLVWTRSAKLLLACRSRSWSVMDAICVRARGAGRLVAINQSRHRSVAQMVDINWCRCWRVEPVMVVGTRSSGRLAPMNRSGRRGVMGVRVMAVMSVMRTWRRCQGVMTKGVMRTRRRGMVVVVVRARCVMAVVRSGRRDHQQDRHHHGHRWCDRRGHGDKLQERRHPPGFLTWASAHI